MCTLLSTAPSYAWFPGASAKLLLRGTSPLMKLLPVLLLCSAALVAAQTEVQTVDPASTSGSCYQMPTCETPPGTDGWMKCVFVTSGPTVRVCTAVCNQPFFRPSPNDPTTLCNSTGGWEEPKGTCTPTTENCVNTEPPSRGGTIVDWRCITIAVGDYAKRCLGACSNNWKPANGENPAAHCNRYSGKWEVTGICVEPSCSATPDFPAPSNTVGWTNCRSAGGNVYTCTAPCKPDYVPSPVAPTATCDLSSGAWTGSTGACEKQRQCTRMPPADTNPRPSNSLGWSVFNCRTIGDQYFCTAECQAGFSGSPTASCDKNTGQWSQTSGTCREDNTNKCTRMPPPGTQIPANSNGWMLSGCSLVTATFYECIATCRLGYFGAPSVSCDPRTGLWSSVQGACRDRPDSGCSGTPVSSSGTPFPDPSGSEGWDTSYCFTSSGNYICQAPCRPDFEPVGSIPFSICTRPPGASSASWSPVQGRCQSTQVSCTNIPPYSAPRNTIGWQQEYCREVNQQYICTAYCATGYKQGFDGLPSSSCDVMTGQWTGVGGSCVPDNGGSNGCSALPNSQPPKNSLGWRQNACYTTGFGPRATTTCYATCDYGYTGSGAHGYDPYATCDWTTGQWSNVNGFCIPENGGGECDAGYPNVPEPPNTYGWSCSTMGWGPYVQRVCTASCKPGYYGFPCAPSISCTGSGSWSGVKGDCVPYQQPSQPCWGYPGGKPTCYGGKAKWRSSCGGAGYCYKSHTYAKNCGSKCNLYCPSHVKHGTRCTAPCSGGTIGSFQSTCMNGKWTTIGGGCRAR